MTLTDLSSGLLIAALWMAMREPKRGLLPLRWLGLLLFGNIGTLAFVLRSIGAANVRDVLATRRAPDA